MTILGVDDLNRALMGIARRVPREAGAALLDEARGDMVEAQRRTPVDTGELRDSFRLVGPRQQGDAISVAIVNDAPHAAAVHEDMEAHHAKGQSKFLESTVLESKRTLAQRIARRFRIERLVR